MMRCTLEDISVSWLHSMKLVWPESPYTLWLHSMKSALAYVEASIDFADEEIPKDLIRKTKKLIIKTKNEIKDYANTFQKHNRIKDGIRVVILGIPNSGKSTLIKIMGYKKAFLYGCMSYILRLKNFYFVLL